MFLYKTIWTVYSLLQLGVDTVIFKKEELKQNIKTINILFCIHLKTLIL